MTIDPVDLAARLIACPSVTPREAGSLTVLGEALEELGFTVHRFLSGSPPEGPVENMVATRGSGGPHFGFAGHVDVVPPGEGWRTDPFTPVIEGGLLYGRGAVDMKSSIAAFVAACADVPEHKGTLSLLITGDEEGPSRYGTRSIMDWMAERDIRPNMILIGEPTSEDRLGDIVKIGRRGSVNMWITVPGMTLLAWVGVEIAVNSRLDGGKASVPSSRWIASSAATTRANGGIGLSARCG